MSTVVMLVDWPDRYRFFSRWVSALEALGHRSVFITNKLSLYRRAGTDGIGAELIVKTPIRQEARLDGCREIVSGMLSTRQAQSLYWSSRAALERLGEAAPIEAVVLWNGGGVAARALSDECDARRVDMAFLEIANLPGKIVIDPAGVNAASSVCTDIARLDRLDAQRESFESWLESFVAVKSAGPVSLPQAELMKRPDVWATFVNNVGFHLRAVPRDDRTSLAVKAWRLVSRGLQTPPPRAEAEPGAYVLFPMQVSNDTQVLLNSDMDLFGALEWAVRRARGTGRRLLVKPHPAEPDPAVRRRLELGQGDDYSITGGDSFELVRTAGEVVTINSTVGLEARLVEVPVTFLGRTPYRLLDTRERVMKYVQSYLVNVDYFADGDVSPEVASILLERARGSW